MTSHIRSLAVVVMALPALSACGNPYSEVPVHAFSAAPATSPAPTSSPASSGQAGLDGWVRDFLPRARAAGVGSSTLDRTMRNVRYNPEVIRLDRNQAEFTRTIWDYLDGAVSDTRIANGRAALAQHRDVLERIEARFGVEKEVVVAIWGMESSYGRNRGTTQLIPALATLAYDGRRGAFFEEQLIAALKIVEAGDIEPARLTGSWAGAMGHTQFMPTSYLTYAVDFTGDGRRDIWSDDPTDALASAAAYLSRSGWTTGQPWGVEVSLPQGFDMSQAGKGNRRPVSHWTSQGVRTIGGSQVADHGQAAILLPAGARGPAFMIFGNFTAISRYNNADSYVIGVGHLADRLRGDGPFRTPWPRNDRALNAAERTELQRLLTARGFDTGGIDGRLGSNSIAAIEAYQRSAGLVPDGYASVDLLNRLR